MKLKRELINALWTLWPATAGVRIAGRRYRVPLQRGFDRRLLHPGREPWLDAILAETCAAPGAVLLDVGANCGQTLLKAKALNPELRYVGCEPNPACAGYVQALIALNHLADCTLLPCGLGREPAITPLHAAHASDPAATTIANFRGTETGKMQLTALIERGDDALARLGLERVDLIKIDVEGAEAEVLAGLQATLERYRPAIVCEVLRSYDERHPTHALRAASKREIADRLSALGYHFFGIDGRERTAVGELNDAFRNYFFRPER